MNFPGNFDLLHGREEEIRAQSKASILASEDLLLHANVVEASMSLIEHFAHVYIHESEDQLIIQLLGIRLFNSAAGAIQDLLSGYYQNSVSHIRDILEVGFLIDYFQIDSALISEWKNCSESERNNKFGAITIRKKLDKRDGFTEEKRRIHYKLLCELGAHATFKGFDLLRPVLGGAAYGGPYFTDNALRATLEELAKVIGVASSSFIVFFDERTAADSATKAQYIKTQLDWVQKFMKHPSTDREVERVRKDFERARDGE